LFYSSLETIKRMAKEAVVTNTVQKSKKFTKRGEKKVMGSGGSQEEGAGTHFSTINRGREFPNLATIDSKGQ